jgi:SAF domain-containing protein
MSTSTMTGRKALATGPSGGWLPKPVRQWGIRPARLLTGVLLVLLLALAGVVAAVRVDTRVPVLAAATTIGAGQVLTVFDVTVVKVAADAGLATIPAGQASTVLGRVAAVPLVAGTLLSPAQFGGPVWPGAGQAVIAVPVKPGRLPSRLGAGAKVSVLVVPATTPATAPAGAAEAAGGCGGGPQVPVAQATATVVSVQPAPDQSGAAVVTLLLGAGDGARIACAAGDVALMQVGG